MQAVATRGRSCAWPTDSGRRCERPLIAWPFVLAEDRLPNEGVKSQQPRFWESLRKQILRCQTPKVMAAAVIKFAAQVKDCVVMQDWENKVLAAGVCLVSRPWLTRHFMSSQATPVTECSYGADHVTFEETNLHPVTLHELLHHHRKQYELDHFPRTTAKVTPLDNLLEGPLGEDCEEVDRHVVPAGC